MDRTQCRIRGCGDDGAALHDAAIPMPPLPQTGKRQRASVPSLEIIRLALVALLSPLVETVGRYQATPATKGGAKRGFIGYAFCACVDHAVTNRRIFRPGGNQAPAQQSIGAPLLRVLTNDENVLTRSDVVPARQLVIDAFRADTELRQELA